MSSLFNPRPAATIGMFRRAVGMLRKMAARIGGFAGASATASDPTCDRNAGLNKIPPLVRGLVVRSGIGSYDCEVVIDGGTMLVCSALVSTLSPLYGVSEAAVPVPGTYVLVYAPPVGLSEHRVMRGVILGVLPESLVHGISRDGKAAIKKFTDTDYPEGGVAQFTEAGPAAVASDENYLYRGDFQCGRPHDSVPGEYALLNHSGAGMVIGAVSTAIKGSEMASVRCSALDDQVRITSGHFRHINAAGGEEIYNDGGYVTVESFVSMYHHERLGLSAANREAFTQKRESIMSLAEKRTGIDPLKPTQTAKKRFYRYAGYLGDIVNVFVASPDPGKDVEEMEDPGRDSGLLHYHVDSSGRFTMRSAGGILFERYDRIPVPKRTHYAWDPAGDKAGDSPADKKPFTIEGGSPLAGGLAICDMAAWWDSQSYARFVQFGKDFSVLKQADLKCPVDEYDKYGHGSESFQKYDLLHSYMGLLPNGGIVLRDAWGSEIVMADGRITFNAAANIEIRSGSSVVVLGGDDVVAKAYNSVDISATNKDVRIKAQGNLQAVSMERGVLIQSKAESDTDPSVWEKPGEELQSAGVIIKADKSSVVVAGKRAMMQGNDGVNLAAFTDKNPSGAVVLAGKQVSTVATEKAVSSVGGTSGLILDAGGAMLCAPSVLAVGASSAAQVAGNKIVLGMPVDTEENLYSSVIRTCKSDSELYLNSVKWLSPMPPTAFSKIDFRFRTTEQYGTKQDSGVSGGAFSVYEPSWAAMADAQRQPLDGIKTQAWEEKPDAGKEEKAGYPWPGAGAMRESSYCVYREQNMAKNGTEDVKSGKALLTREAFSQYHIRKST